MKNNIEIFGDLTIVKLQNGHETIIDTEMIPRVSDFKNKWHAQRPTDKFYVCGSIKGKSYKLHRWIMNVPDGVKLMVDHINGNTMDNRKVNLRIVTPTQNQQNRMGAQKNCKSGIRGVCWHKQRNKWTTHIRANGKRVYLGLFDELEDAEKAVIKARQNLMTHSVS